MIETLYVARADFDLDGFIEGYRQFYAAYAGDTNADMLVSYVKSIDDTPMPNHDGTPPKELLERGLKVFFQSHVSTVEETVLCIDRGFRRSELFDINVADGYGWLLEVEDERVALYPCLYDGTSGPFPALHVQSQCSVLDDAMMSYARKFISGPIQS